jgi:drug/metabolite transporter (DMT)-like permease
VAGNDWLLLLPAGSAVLYVVAAFLLKQAIGLGAGQAQVNLFANVFAGVLFLPLAAFAGEVDWSLAWMPLVAGATFFLGQFFTFSALRHGDVSVATPLLGMKVLFIAVVSWLVFGEELAVKWWAGAAASSFGVILVTGATLGTLVPRLLRADALMSLAAAAAFAVTDVLVRQWAGRFGIAAFIPLMFGEVALLSLVMFLPRGGLRLFRPTRAALMPLTVGSVALSVQALGMALALGLYGNATAVNIVYSARSVWSVILAWLLARHFTTVDSVQEPAVVRRRLAGSILLFAAVVLVLI